MAHTRNRHVVTTLSKKLRFSPVVTLQGVRQCGKSFLVRELLPKSLQRAHYETFDRLVTRDFATTNPETFLLRYEESAPLIIDEAQKVPEIFDAIKYEVDKKRTPGKFLLLGSTEFSKMTHVSESLTGRMSRIRVFPLSLSETLDLPPRRIRLLDPFSKLPRVERGHLVKYLDHGGMPAIFSIRNVHEMQQAFDDWVTLTVE
ncbi:MAG: AAA family ATPase, partial [Deltaproteobacteria bacterium]|nr:AAA family ATPase [Deltaproteobacteria bacterium]